MATTEEKVANTILQEKQVIKVAGVEYEVSQPSMATLIKVSSIVSTIPKLNINDSKIIEQAIAIAPECGKQIAEIIATLILGAKKDDVVCRVNENMPFFAFISRFKQFCCRKGKTIHDNLFNALMYDVTPRELSNLVIRLISMMQIEDFFGVTISLNEINLIRATREMVTTQHGQLSQEQQRDLD